MSIACRFYFVFLIVVVVAPCATFSLDASIINHHCLSIYKHIYQRDQINPTQEQRQSLFSVFLPQSNAGLMIIGADELYPSLNSENRLENCLNLKNNTLNSAKFFWKNDGQQNTSTEKIDLVTPSSSALFTLKSQSQ